MEFINPETSVTKMDSNLKISFSSREVDFIKSVAAEASTTKAAVQPVRDYISTIVRRLNAKNRTEVAVKAIRMGIID